MAKGNREEARTGMAKRPRLTRWDAIWAGGAVLLFMLFAAAARTPFFDLIRLLFVGVLMVLCISDWRTRGHGWFPTLSWTVPLGGLWMVGQWLVDGPVIHILLIYWLGFVSMMAMLVSKRAARWWYEVVLRRLYKT